jgi:ABC-type phosphonate transport system ATPase subunit
MPILETIQLSRSFGELLAVDSVSLAVDPGEVFGLLGSTPNWFNKLVQESPACMPGEECGVPCVRCAWIGMGSN